MELKDYFVIVASLNMCDTSEEIAYKAQQLLDEGYSLDFICIALMGLCKDYQNRHSDTQTVFMMDDGSEIILNRDEYFSYVGANDHE